MVEPRWGLGDAVVGFVLSILGAAVTLSVVLAVTGDDADDLSLGATNIAQIGLWVPLLGVPIWAAWRKGNGIVRDFGLKVKDWDLPLGGVSGVATQLILLPLLYIPIFVLTNADSDDLSEVAKDLSDKADNGFGIAMLIILTGIGAPICEEIFYRGLLLRSLERRFGQVVAVVASGLIFGLVHLNVLSTPGLALFGMVLAVLAIKTGRLGAPIAAHMAFNLIAVATLLADR